MEPMTPEQMQDFAALEAMAGAGEPVGGQMPEQPGQNPAEAWAMIPAMIGGALAIGIPELRKVYCQDACMAWGSAMVPVADKYGWSADSIMGPELGLLAASLPLILGTVTCIKAKKAELSVSQGLQEGPAPEPPQAPGQKTVTFGVPMGGVSENQ